MTVLNFAAETVFEANTTSGNVSLTRIQLESLVDGNYTTGGVDLSGDNILALDVDLGNRVATKDLRYYFSSASPTGAVASGISFYYRDYTTDPWSSLTTTYGAGYYTTTSGNFFPHQVRVVHTISGTSISGTLREYEVNSNEDIVDYGEDGTLTEKGLTDTPFGTSDPYTIPVYNDGDKSATAYVYIGNTGTEADDMLRISDAQTGTYVGIDDGPVIGGEGYQWGLGSYSDTTLDSNKLVLDGAGSVSYSSGWDNIGTTLDNDCRPAGIAWHPTDPWQSILFYIRNQTMYKYELATGVHVSLGATPRNTSSTSYGGNNDLVYDSIGNRLYYFLWKDTTSEFAHFLAYYYDLDTGLWSVSVVDNDFGNDGRKWDVRGAFFEYQGTTNSKDGLFDVGERYIVITISSGHSTVFRNYRLRLSDHDFSILTASGYNKHTGDYTGTLPSACGVCIQQDNLGSYPAGTVAVIWSYAGSSESYEYLNAYYITDQTGAAQTWSPTRLFNISPRDPSVTNWFYNEDFTGRGKFFFYDDSADKLYMSSDYSNDVYAIWYNIGGGNPSEGYILYRYYIAAVNFFDSGNWGNGYLFGDAKRYDDGLFWFMGRLYDEQLWMQFPTDWSNTVYETSGTYTTPILKNQDPTYWYVKSEIPENTQIATTSGVVAPTIEVRSSNTPPSYDNFHRIIWFARRPTSDDHLMLICTDYDGTELWTYDHNHFWYTGNAVESMQGWAYASNKFYPTGSFSSTFYFFVTWYWSDGSPSDGILYGYLFDINGNVTRSKQFFDLGYTTNYYRPTNTIFNKNNLLYTTHRGVGTEPDHLRVYDTYLNVIADISFAGDQSTLYSLCLADDEEDIWVIKEDENAVYRYNQNLVQQNIIENNDFGNLNGICEDGGGGIFIGDTSGTARKIWHYDADGNFIEVFDLTSYVSSIHRIRPDYFGGVWACDTSSDRLVRFASNGTFIGQVNLGAPNALDSTFAGCWVMSESYEKLYFVDLDLNLQKTIDTTAWGGADPRSTANPSRDGDNWRSAYAKNIDVSGYSDTDDIGSSDPVWGTGGDLEWNEVSKDTNFVHHQLYHQARITLRSDGTDTPEVEKIALPPTIELTNIAPQGSKNSYMKTVVASGTVRSRQSGKLRTWFSLEE